MIWACLVWRDMRVWSSQFCDLLSRKKSRNLLKISWMPHKQCSFKLLNELSHACNVLVSLICLKRYQSTHRFMHFIMTSMDALGLCSTYSLLIFVIQSLVHALISDLDICRTDLSRWCSACSLSSPSLARPSHRTVAQQKIEERSSSSGNESGHLPSPLVRSPLLELFSKSEFRSIFNYSIHLFKHAILSCE